MGDPVEAVDTVVALDARTGDHDVVSTLGVIVVLAAVTDQDIVARIVDVVEERSAAVTLQQVVGVAAFFPVVSASSEDRVRAVACKHQVISFPGECHVAVQTAVGEIVSVSGHDDVQPGAGVDGVVSGSAFEHVVSMGVGDDVVALTAQNGIGAVVAF